MTRAVVLLASVALAAATLAACGGKDSSSADANGATATAKSGTAGTQHINVTSLPIADAGPYFWALDTGLFRKHGLDVTDQVSQGGAAGIPGLVSGDIDVVFSNVVSAIIAKQKGLPIKLILGGDNSVPPPKKDAAALMVAPDSSVTKAQDLAGKTIGVNTLNNIDDLYDKVWLQAHGVSPSSVKFVEIPFPEHPAALLQDRVDAIQTAPPFSVKLEERGAKVLGYPHQENPGAPIAGYVVTDRFLAEHGDAVKRFRAAMIEAARQTSLPKNRKRYLAIVSKRTKIDVPTLRKSEFPDSTMTIDEQGMRKTIDYMEKFGLLTSKISDPSAFLHSLISQP